MIARAGCCALACACAGWTLSAGAYSSGISGYTQGLACMGCHNNGVGTTIPATGFSGPDVVVTGSSNSYSFGISAAGNGAVGGLDVSASAGTLATVAGSNTELLSGEITHTAPRSYIGAATSWTFTLTAPAAEGSLTLAGCGLNANHNGTDTGDAGACTAKTITVKAPPVAGDDSYLVTEDSGTSNLAVLANDSDSSAIRVTAVNGSSSFPVLTAHGGSLALSGPGAGNQLLYTPAADFSGTDTFTYQVTDTYSISSSGQVTVTVSAVNDAPRITAPPPDRAVEGLPYSAQLPVTDPDDA
ncbi:MAG TPA: choice-of-anchor V domain-containing protein, partial [Nevskiaceae bacterium]|nr:choice-of-anchor V domain-containing protein [Nevskiaceae bacterium]